MRHILRCGHYRLLLVPVYLSAIILAPILILTYALTTPRTPTIKEDPIVKVTAAASADDWELWTSGTRLRGANVYQRLVYPEVDGPDFMGSGPLGPPYTQADLDALAAAGANWVQLSHPGLFTEKPPYVLNGDVQDSLDRLLDMVGKAGMKATIAFRTGPGRSDFTFYWDGAGEWFDPSYLNDNVWVEQEAQDAWVAMWRYTAERYRDHPAVIGYELMVEPNSNDRLLGVWDPEEFYSRYGGSLYDWNQLYPRITAAVRDVDTDTPILVGGNDYSNSNWLPYLSVSGDDRTVYIVHQYEPMIYTHQDADSLRLSYPGVFDAKNDSRPETVDKAWLEVWLSPIDSFRSATGAPVAVSEYGIKRWVPDAARFIDDELGIFEASGLNYAVWIWDPVWQAWNNLNDDFSLRDGPDPNNHVEIENQIMTVTSKYWWFNRGGKIVADQYFAEGSTQPGFQEYLLVLNKNDQPAHVRVIYTFDDGTSRVQNVTAAGESRITIWVNGFVAEGKDFSCRVQADQTVVSEKAMYFNDGAH